MALSIASIDLLDAEDVYASLDFSETEPASKGLEELGYESKNFLLNGGTLLMTIQMWAVLAVLVTLGGLLCKSICGTVGRMNRCCRSLDLKLKWNFYFELFFAAQIDLFCCVLI